MIYNSKAIIISWLLLLAKIAAKAHATKLETSNNQQNTFFGSSWPIEFKQNAQTLPSIGIKLEPAEDPLPQVSAEIQLREQARIRLEEGLMGRLEDEFNRQLDLSQHQIENAIERAIRVFNSQDFLQGVISGSMLPITTKMKQIKISNGSFAPKIPLSRGASSFSFKQVPKREISKNGPLPRTDPTMSFIETSHKSSEKQSFVNLGGAIDPPPSVKIQLTDIHEPDVKIKQKIDQIEQMRTDEEVKLIEQAASEFSQITKITIQELEKNLQIQMNPFLVDVTAITRQVDRELPKRNKLSRLMSFKQKKINQNRKNTVQSDDLGQYKENSLSFLETKQKAKFLNTGTEKQLNVKIMQSDKPYPTIDELASDMEKKRDATERLERMSILELQLKLMKAQNEMIRDTLRTAISRVIAQYAPAVEGIKTEIAVEKIRD